MLSRRVSSSPSVSYASRSVEVPGCSTGHHDRCQGGDNLVRHPSTTDCVCPDGPSNTNCSDLVIVWCDGRSWSIPSGESRGVATDLLLSHSGGFCTFDG